MPSEGTKLPGPEVSGDDIGHVELWRASWEGLARLARSLGLRVREGPEEDRRTRLVEAMVRRMNALTLSDAARRKRPDQSTA